MPAPATISQTSLPSHTGPIALIATRRSSSFVPDEVVQHADAEVEALEEQKAAPQDGEHHEPEYRE